MIEKLIKKVAASLDQNKISYMIIGGQAVLLYGSVRLTKDIDITLGVDTDKFETIKRLCQEMGLKFLSDAPKEFALETKVLPVEDAESGIRVDFIFSFSLYEQQAFKRVNQVLIDKYPVKFASAEDIIIHKMLAGRAVDKMDVKHILLKHQKTLDMDYISKWLKEFERMPEYGSINQHFQSIIGEIHS